jgi:eukaryotic translation initiation factor 2C
MDNSQNALIASFRSLSVRDSELPLRPDFGSLGVPIKLRANFFPVKVPKGPLFEYDVTISPTAGTAIRRVKRRIFQLAEQTPDWAQQGLRGNVAHDHSAKLIAAKRLSQPLVIRVPFYDEDEQGPKAGGKEYTLTIEFIQNIDTQSLLKYAVFLPMYISG